MRIVAGKLKGRILQDPKSHNTHPMSEKIRGALFNALGDIADLTVLDAFTGSGAVAIEAWSRGASSVLAIDVDKDAYSCADKNVKNLGLTNNISVLRKNIKSWSNNNTTALFDIVIADPPFDVVNDALLEKVAKHVKAGGIFIVSVPSDYLARQNKMLKIIDTKMYGDAKLAFYRRIG